MPSPRDVLKSAIRANPRHQREGSRDISNYSVKQLYALAHSLGMDPSAICRAARGVADRTGKHLPTQLDGRIIPPTPDTMMHDPNNPYVLVKGFRKVPKGFVPVTDNQGDQDEAAPVDATVDDAVESEVRAIREAVTERGFSALDERLRDLITEARKPPVTVYVDVPVAAGQPGTVTGAAPVIVSKPTGKSVTWKEAFRVKGPLGDQTAQVWDGAHPDTPKIDPLYIWPERQTAIALSEIADGQNVFLFGPAGTGKTEWAQQLAATLGRPFALISCDQATDGPTLVGMTVPQGDSVRWQDGQLTRAIQIPGCVVCIDEPSVARSGALFAMQNVLSANRMLWIAETGRRVPVARGVTFIACDNTAGMGGGARRGYTDTNRLNTAYLDRFGARVKFEYLPERDEARVIAARTGCTRELANLLIKAATLTRTMADAEQLTSGLGLRRLLAWARLLTRGHDVGYAFECAIINASPDQDHETLRQQCALAVDAANVAAALNPVAATPPQASDPSVTNPSLAGRNAAREFSLSAN